MGYFAPMQESALEKRRRRWFNKVAMTGLSLGRLRIGNVLVDNLSHAGQPTVEQCQTWLRDLQSEFNSERLLGAVLGVSRLTVRGWLQGRRNPSAAARRLIWLVRNAWDGQAAQEFDLLGWLLWKVGQADGDQQPASEAPGDIALQLDPRDGVTMEARKVQVSDEVVTGDASSAAYPPKNAQPGLERVTS